MMAQEDSSEGGLFIRRRVKKEKVEDDLEFEVEVRRVSADDKLVSLGGQKDWLPTKDVVVSSHQFYFGIFQDSLPKEEKEEMEEQKGQEFEVQKVTIPIDGNLVSSKETKLENLRREL